MLHSEHASNCFPMSNIIPGRTSTVAVAMLERPWISITRSWNRYVPSTRLAGKERPHGLNHITHPTLNGCETKKERYQVKHWAAANGIERNTNISLTQQQGSVHLWPKKRHIRCSAVGYGAPEHQRVLGRVSVWLPLAWATSGKLFAVNLIKHRITGHFLEWFLSLFFNRISIVLLFNVRQSYFR